MKDREGFVAQLCDELSRSRSAIDHPLRTWFVLRSHANLDSVRALQFRSTVEDVELPETQGPGEEDRRIFLGTVDVVYEHDLQPVSRKEHRRTSRAVLAPAHDTRNPNPAQGALQLAAFDDKGRMPTAHAVPRLLRAIDRSCPRANRLEEFLQAESPRIDSILNPRPH